MSSVKFKLLAFIVCLLGASFYMYEFALQVSLSVMTQELMQDLALNATSLGFLSASFYYSYMIMQVPAGLLHDRLGPRLVLTLAILICALGALIFSYSHGLWDAALGRFMMGIGSAFSFSGALMLISRWFPPQQFAILSGFVQLMSAVGAIEGEVLLSLAIKQWGWQSTLFYLAIGGLGLAGLVWLIVRNYPYQTKRIIPSPINQHTLSTPELKKVFSKGQPWWLALYSFLIWAPIAAFAGLWGVPFLVVAYDLTTTTASIACTAIWIGIGFGSPFIGWISEYIERRLIILSICSGLGVISMLAILYLTPSLPILYIALFLLGFAGSGQSLAFSVVRDINHPSLIGAAIGLNNMATVAGGAILQPIIGYLIHISSTGLIQNGAPVYTVSDYKIALILLPLCYLSAFFIGLKCIEETYCKQNFAYS